MSPLDATRAAISGKLDEIAKLFTSPTAVTLLVRPDLGPDKDGYSIMTSDTLPRAIAALERRHAVDQDDADPDRQKLRRIPISAGRLIAEVYGYDQVVIYARRCHTSPEPHGEHMVTYGRTRAHCAAAARIGTTLKRFMGWAV